MRAYTGIATGAGCQEQATAYGSGSPATDQIRLYKADSGTEAKARQDRGKITL